MIKYLLRAQPSTPPDYELLQRLTPTSSLYPPSTNSPNTGQTVILSPDANTLIVSAPYANILKPDGNVVNSSGAVHILKKNENNLYQTDYTLSIEPSDIVGVHELFGGGPSPVGTALSRSGDVLVVGCPMKKLYVGPGGTTIYESGCVYVYTKVGGQFTLKTRIDYPGIATNSTNFVSKKQTQFGASVAVSDNGSIIAIGAYHDKFRAADNTYAGAVHIYKLVDGEYQWIQELFLQAPQKTYPSVANASENALSMTGDGKTLFVGCKFYRVSGAAQPGAVFQYNMQADGKFQSAPIVILPPSTNVKEFGKACVVSKDGSLLAVSSPNESVVSPTNGVTYKTGVVYVYKRSNDGMYNIFQRLTPDDFFNGGTWGDSVAISDDNKKIIIGWVNGRKQGLDGSYSSVGAISVFAEDENLQFQQISKQYGRTTSSGFGSAVATDQEGNTMVVGSPLYSSRKGEITIYV